ncbi:MAG: hypothetical protein SFU20_00955 [Chitinophagaceae bacterium]|nr:hypothetical protein [Chitinophagaceae bacterium]
MILFTERISSRLTYFAEFLSGECLEQGLVITSDKEQYLASTEPRINYSPHKLTDKEIHIIPEGLLFEKNIRSRAILCEDWQGMPGFFFTGGDIPFDLFSAAFYLLSRYEEYLPYEKDEYGRYGHLNSIAFKNEFLHRPLINEWLMAFKEKVLQLFPGYTFRLKAFDLLPTYDIDIAYSYKGKGWARNGVALMRSLLKGDGKAFNERRAVLEGKAVDPYDCYDWLDELHLATEYPAIYFFHVGQRRGIYDKNIHPGQPVLQQLIKRTVPHFPVGIHPSWRSGDEENLLEKEIQILSGIAGNPVTISRFHYIRFHLPVSYRRLIALGIRHDHSMGYGSINGFRASVASPFYWYDLEREERTSLLIYPFCYMEANSYFEQNQNAEQAYAEMMGYAKKVREVKGMMITIWHNHFLGESAFKGEWRKIYAQFLHHQHAL